MKCAWCKIETEDTYCGTGCRMKREAKHKANSREWRDVGGGKIECDNTHEVARLSPDHRVEALDHQDRTVTFTPQEWANLVDLANRRTRQSRTRYTPERCVREFAQNVFRGPQWEHPSMTKAI